MSMSQFSRAGEERENLSNHPPRAHTTVKKIASRKSYRNIQSPTRQCRRETDRPWIDELRRPSAGLVTTLDYVRLGFVEKYRNPGTPIERIKKFPE